MVPALKPDVAYAKMAHREIELVAIDDVDGRVTGVLLTPYPPGIPLLIPGERFNAMIVGYLQFALEFNAQFPGFESSVHCLVQEQDDNGDVRFYVDCIKEDNDERA